MITRRLEWKDKQRRKAGVDTAASCARSSRQLSEGALDPAAAVTSQSWGYVNTSHSGPLTLTVCVCGCSFGCRSHDRCGDLDGWLVEETRMLEGGAV